MSVHSEGNFDAGLFDFDALDRAETVPVQEVMQLQAPVRPLPYPEEDRRACCDCLGAGRITQDHSLECDTEFPEHRREMVTEAQHTMPYVKHKWVSERESQRRRQQALEAQARSRRAVGQDPYLARVLGGPYAVSCTPSQMPHSWLDHTHRKCECGKPLNDTCWSYCGHSASRCIVDIRPCIYRPQDQHE